MCNIKIELEYDGTNFSGWQIQPNKRTVQGTITSSLKKFLVEDKLKLTGVSRTDAGVHALSYVANFKTKSKLGVKDIRNALNSHLPSDIYVHKALEVDADFNSRYSAKNKIYRYRILPHFSPLRKNFTWQIRYQLAMSPMKRASKYLTGKKDFTPFSVEENNRVVNVKKANLYREGDELIFEIEANRFLNKMVRMIVGTLVEIGRGKIKPLLIKELLNNGKKGSGGPTAPPQGLYLVKVKY